MARGGLYELSSSTKDIIVFIEYTDLFYAVRNKKYQNERLFIGTEKSFDHAWLSIFNVVYILLNKAKNIPKNTCLGARWKDNSKPPNLESPRHDLSRSVSCCWI